MLLFLCNLVFNNGLFLFIESKNYEITVFILKVTDRSEGVYRCHSRSMCFVCSVAHSWRDWAVVDVLSVESVGLSLEPLRASMTISLGSLRALSGRGDGSLP